MKLTITFFRNMADLFEQNLDNAGELQKLVASSQGKPAPPEIPFPRENGIPLTARVPEDLHAEGLRSKSEASENN